MTLAQLRALIAVVEARGFSEAAERLAMTQSGVSHAVASLETELGVPLLRRARGGPVPTAVGERIVAHAREILNRQEHIRQEAAVAAGFEGGRVRIAAPPSVAGRLLPAMLGDARRRHPGIDVVLFEGSDVEVDCWLRSGVVDLGIVPLPARGLDLHELVSDEMLVVVPAAHRLAGRASVRLREVAAEPFIMSKGGCEPMIRDLYRGAGIHPRVQHEVRDTPTILAMVEEGLGITMMPALALPARHPRLRTLRVDPPARRRLALAALSLDPGSPAVVTFVQEARRWTRTRFARSGGGVHVTERGRDSHAGARVLQLGRDPFPRSDAREHRHGPSP